MEIVSTQQVTLTTVDALQCDVCERIYPDMLERQEFLRYSDTAGYGSIFGDGNQLALDMCMHCVRAKLSEWLRITSGTEA